MSDVVMMVEMICTEWTASPYVLASFWLPIYLLVLLSATEAVFFCIGKAAAGNSNTRLLCVLIKELSISNCTGVNLVGVNLLSTARRTLLKRTGLKRRTPADIAFS